MNAVSDRKITFTAARRLLAGFPAWPIYLALFIAVAATAILTEARGGDFFTVPNVRDMLIRSVALGLVSAGQTLVIIGGSLDLSVANLISLSTLSAAVIMGGDPAMIPVGIGAVLLIGIVFGIVNGLIITKLRVNPLIATLGTALILRGILDANFEGVSGEIPQAFERLGYGNIGPIPVSILLLAVVVFLVSFLLRSTSFGYRLYAVGGDAETARLSGVRTDRVIIIAHALCSLAAVITGLFIASRLGTGDPYVGSEGGYDLESIAAVVVGGTALAGGRGGVAGTIGGVLLLAVLDNLFNEFQVNAFLKEAARGVIIIAAVAVYALRRHQKGSE